MKKGQPILIREFLKGLTLQEWQDGLYARSFLHYQHQTLLLAVAQQVFQGPLRPSANYSGLFKENEGAEAIHYDVLEQEWTLEICFNQKRPWPFFINQENEFFNSGSSLKALELSKGEVQDLKDSSTSYVLNPGDALFFSGHQHPHWREPVQAGNFCERAFFYFESRMTSSK